MADPTQVQSNATTTASPFPQSSYQFYATTGAGPPAARQIQQAGAAIESSQRIWTLSYSGYVPKYTFMIGLGDRSEFGLGGISPPGSSASGNIVTTNGYIVLPLPKGLEDRQTINYSEYDIGPFFGQIFQTQTGDSVRQAISEGLQGRFQQALNSINQALARLGPNDPNQSWLEYLRSIGEAAVNVGGGLALGLYQNVAPQAAVGIPEAAAGVSINQFYTILLRGPAYKEHTLTFFLAPRNAQESTNIRDIIKRLRAAAAPYLTTGKFFWGFPQIASCSFIPQGQAGSQQTYMYAFKPAVITGVSARYDSGDSVAFYKQQGAPESVVLTISLKEIEYWTSEDYGGRQNG